MYNTASNTFQEYKQVGDAEKTELLNLKLNTTTCCMRMSSKHI